jgi:hypothetical protein
MLPAARWASGAPAAASHLARALAANTMPTPIHTAALPAAGAVPATAIAHPAPGRELKVVVGKAKGMTTARPAIRHQAAVVGRARAIHRAAIARKAPDGRQAWVAATVRNPVADDRKVTADQPVAGHPAAAAATAPAIAEQLRDTHPIEVPT